MYARREGPPPYIFDKVVRFGEISLALSADPTANRVKRGPTPAGHPLEKRPESTAIEPSSRPAGVRAPLEVESSGPGPSQHRRTSITRSTFLRIRHATTDPPPRRSSSSSCAPLGHIRRAHRQHPADARRAARHRPPLQRCNPGRRQLARPLQLGRHLFPARSVAFSAARSRRPLKTILRHSRRFNRAGERASRQSYTHSLACIISRRGGRGRIRGT